MYKPNYERNLNLGNISTDVNKSQIEKQWMTWFSPAVAASTISTFPIQTRQKNIHAIVNNILQ